MSIKRLSKELISLRKLSSNKDSLFVAAPESSGDLRKWIAMIRGPPDSPYEDGVWFLKLSFSQEYPFKPPSVIFMNKIYHPNIDSSGSICLDILKSSWAPSLNIEKLLTSLISLLTDPNENDPLSSGPASVYKKSKREYAKNVKEWINEYALEKNRLYDYNAEDGTWKKRYS